MMGLAKKVGKDQAHHLVYDAASQAHENKISLREVLLATSEITQVLSEKEIDNLINPINYIGVSEQMIENVVNKIE
jgi:adenylosuccinate lyase